jgi:CheY-like chemotaxis protein
MPQPSPEPNGLSVYPDRPVPSLPEVRTEGFDGVRDIEALGRVASVIGHELTNVLQVLSNSIDRLADPVTTGSAIVRMARASLERGVRLARQLQAFARVAPPRVQRLDTHQALATWLPLFEEAIGPDRTLELRLRVGGAILVDPGQLQTAIAHLLTNARDATPPGAVIVAELSRVERAAGPACRIAVTDRGEGMTPEVARQAVEPFFTTRAPGHGLGLGLTIARMVAESHGGYLEVDSRVGTGTTVSISLPIADGGALSPRAARTPRTTPPTPFAAPVHAAPTPSAPETPAVPATPAAPAAPTAPGAPATRPGGTPPAGIQVGTTTARPADLPAPVPAPKPAPRILVVDDEEAIAEYFRIILSAEQYDVTVVASLQRAIETFTRDHLKFDTVLLDMMLGDGTGLDLYRRVREMRPDLPVVVCTGFAENDSLELIREDGHEVLLKPCTRHEVLRAVNRALLRRRLA